MFYLVYLTVLSLCLVFYFRLALLYNITDKPNHRSSHNKITIRGGGIVFPFALLLHASFTGIDYPFFISGLLIISIISFYDDLKPLSSRIRLLVHLLAVSLLFYQAGLFTYPSWIIIPVYVVVIGAINAYNFMDGINGITGAYSLLTILSLYFINEYYISFALGEWLLVTALALLVFNFFNFRTIAKCFAGDIGSISVAFILIFFILLLIIKTEDLKYIGLLLLYGLDSVSTIIFRLIRRENIFEAHRSHFYQYLVNVKGLPHLRVSALYMMVQLMLNALIIWSDWDNLAFLIFLLVSGIIFVCNRFGVEGKRNLIMRKLVSL